jgi:hypothetical protein
MPHPCVAATAQTVKDLRKASFSTEVDQSVPVVPGVYFSWDVQDGGAGVSVTSQPGGLLRADVRVRGLPRWLTLSINLGQGHFVEREAIGVVIRAACSVAFDLAPFVRSSQDGDKQDTILADRCNLQPVPRSFVLVHDILPREALTLASDFHTLILPLPKQDFCLDLLDLRFFHVGRSDHPAPRRPTLTSVAH